MPDTAPERSYAPQKGGFNYCKVSKAIVALPAWIAIGAIAAALFHEPLIRCLAAAGAIIASYWIAVWIDRLDILRRPVVVREPE